MNMLQRIAAIFTEPKAEDMIMHFVAAKLQTSTAHLLVTDEAMQTVYARLASTLACAYNGELLPVESDMESIVGHEVIMVHSTLNLPLLKAVALRASHVILVVEYLDTSVEYVESMAAIAAECGSVIDFAYMEEGEGPASPYSPTESHYLGHKIRRMVKRLQ
ncbi:hypothetical protein D3C85_770460 [compost metagenome]